MNDQTNFEDGLIDVYADVDRDFNLGTGGNTGFEALIGISPYKLNPQEISGFQGRYQIIKEFQKITLNTFRASLVGESNPEIHRMILADVPEYLGARYHALLTERQHTTPVFFRTDEPIPGKLSEIQCPGSGWCLHQQLWSLYRDRPNVFGKPEYFPESLAEKFAGSVKRLVGEEPLIHHLTENASRPHGMRYFIKKTRDYGARYFSYDRDVSPADCNFFRSHDFYNVTTQNFYTERMRLVEDGKAWFDLPPSALFDGKIIMALPFLKETRNAYSDEIRSIFPYTTIIRPEGIELEDGAIVSIEEFCNRPPRMRDYYIKYGGTDVSINWGSKSVFLASSGSSMQCRKLMNRVLKDWDIGRPWVIQSAFRTKESIGFLDRTGGVQQENSYAKWSSFYGPEGLLGLLVFHKKFSKVHGSEDTIMSIVY